MDPHVAINEDGYVLSLSRNELPLPSIVIAGDLCPSGHSEKFLSTNKAGLLFPEILPTLQTADLSIVNLECPLTRQMNPIIKSGPHLRAEPECAAGIRSAGFDVVSLANNHILDMGAAGLADTVNACAQAGLRTVGAGENLAKATQPLSANIQGIRVAILAFAENEFSIATPCSAGAWPISPIENSRQIEEARLNADFVLALVHGGNEYSALPRPSMTKLCRYFIDLGANAVICNHVHVPSGIEIYERSPIVYSTGNLLFESQRSDADWYRGYLVRLMIQRRAVMSMQLTPYWQSKDQPGVRLMNHCEREQFFGRVSELSALIADPLALEKEWDLFVRSKRVQYLSAILCLSKVERRLLRLGIWPFWRLKRSAGAKLLNLFACESHRDVAITLLSSEFSPKGSSPDRPN